jgi:hypothetical protein
MQSDFWHKQTLDKPLFPELIWSRPENRMYAGKLLIVGGNSQSFTAPAQIFTEATKAGVGTARVLLPDALRKVVGPVLIDGEYAASTPSGSFSAEALAILLEGAAWSDGTLIGGDLGRNSETAILLEKFAAKYSGQLTITKDAVDYYTTTPAPISQRQNTCLVLSFSQLQALGKALHYTQAFTFDMDLLRLVSTLHDFTGTYGLTIVTKHLNQMLVATAGQVSTTKLDTDLSIWRCQVAAHVAVWWAQNPSKTFEAVTIAVSQACSLATQL